MDSIYLRTRRGILLVSSVFLLSACGSGGGDNSAQDHEAVIVSPEKPTPPVKKPEPKPTPPTEKPKPNPTPPPENNDSKYQKGYYVDSPIQGIDYSCEGKSGTTAKNGLFLFDKNKSCTLSIGSLVLRKMDSDRMFNGVIVFESDPNISMFLQSLDADHNPENGIFISDKIKEAISKLKISKIPTDIEDIRKLLKKINIDLISYSRGISHLKRSYDSYRKGKDGDEIVVTNEKILDQIKDSPTLYNMSVFANPLPMENYKLKTLTDEEYNKLNENNKYIVANKLFSTLFYAPKMSEYKKIISSSTFISDMQTLFSRENTDDEIVELEEKIKKFSYGSSSGKIVAPILARLYYLSPGNKYINRWAAYVLSQTILFTPAFELDSVYTSDISNVYNHLVRSFDEDDSMQWTTFTHMISDENWRRFRSPEDNGREMLEIYLGDENDDHVPLAAKALKNWKLDLRSKTLVMSLNENTEPIQNLFSNTTVTNGTDFYSSVVLHPDFLKKTTSRLVDIYFPNFTEETKGEILSKIIKSNPLMWQDVLKQIVFSREYLLNSVKTKSFEEIFYSIAKVLDWKPIKGSFYHIYYNIGRMNQSIMKYKLGRSSVIPVDTQSFAWMHKELRERVLVNYTTKPDSETQDSGWPLTKMFNTLPEELFAEDEPDTFSEIKERERAEYIIREIFISVIGRLPKEDELLRLYSLIENDKYTDDFKNHRWIDLSGNKTAEEDLKDRGAFSRMVLDYISRVKETYQTSKTK